MERIVAYAVTNLVVGQVEIVNPENIPPINLYPTKDDAPAPVFIANHCSQLDVSSVYFAIRRFKWIAKQSVKVIPGAGNIMALGGHVFIQRKGKNRGSVSNLYEQSNQAIQGGIPMILFPQGTRRMSTKLPFKDGAFKIAIENQAPLVPITINVPPDAWNNLYPLNILWGGNKDPSKNKIIMTIHAPIEVKKDMEIQPLKEKCQEIIYSALPPLYHGKKDGSDGGNNYDKKIK